MDTYRVLGFLEAFGTRSRRNRAILLGRNLQGVNDLGIKCDHLFEGTGDLEFGVLLVETIYGSESGDRKFLEKRVVVKERSVVVKTVL